MLTLLGDYIQQMVFVRLGNNVEIILNILIN